MKATTDLPQHYTRNDIVNLGKFNSKPREQQLPSIQLINCFKKKVLFPTEKQITRTIPKEGNIEKKFIKMHNNKKYSEEPVKKNIYRESLSKEKKSCQPVELLESIVSKFNKKYEKFLDTQNQYLFKTENIGDINKKGKVDISASTFNNVIETVTTMNQDLANDLRVSKKNINQIFLYLPYS